MFLIIITEATVWAWPDVPTVPFISRTNFRGCFFSEMSGNILMSTV